MVALTTLPFLINWWLTPPGTHYTWILPPYPEDSFGYMAWAQQAARGALLFKIKYTALPHSAFLFHPLFLICGWLSAFSHCPIGLVFVAAKALGVALFFAVLYRYLDLLHLQRAESIAATVLAGISSGFGGILGWLGFTQEWAVTSADRWMPEVDTFWSLLWNALFPFSLALLVLTMFWLERGTRERRASDFWLSGAATGAAALLHPYYLPLIFSLVLMITIARAKRASVGLLSRYFAAATPSVIYLALLSRFQPVVAQHSANGAMPSPSPFSYVLGFGLPLLILLFGLVVLRAEIIRKHWVALLWFAGAIGFAYLPFWFQRKLTFGAHIPLCIVDGAIIGALLTRWRVAMTLRAAAVLLVLPLFIATPIYLLVTQRQEVRENRDGAYYLTNDVTQALAALREKSDPADIVFATPLISRLIPAFAGNTAVWGHWAMSVDYAERRRSILEALDPASSLDDASRSDKFWSNGIKLIFADSDLKRAIQRSPFLWNLILKDTRKVFENDGVTIYRRDAVR